MPHTETARPSIDAGDAHLPRWGEKDLAQALEAALRENRQLREACEFYGDPETWANSADGIYVQSPLGRDRGTAADGSDCPGAKARQALTRS